MTVQMVIEVQDRQGAQTIMRALDGVQVSACAPASSARNAGWQPSKCSMVWTPRRFLCEMTAEDLAGGDLEYVEWAGEAKLLEGLTTELGELEHAHYRLS